MFSTKLNDNRYYIACMVLTDVPIVHSFIVDTGAMYTCCSYKNVNRNLKEEDFADAESKLIGGIVAGAGIKFYKYSTNQFAVGNIDVGKRDIWITFDDLATDDVLGMDILSDVLFVGDKRSKQFMVYNDEEELRRYYGRE